MLVILDVYYIKDVRPVISGTSLRRKIKCKLYESKCVEYFQNADIQQPLSKRYFDYLSLKINMWVLRCRCDRCPELRRGSGSCIRKAELEVISRNVRERLSGRSWSFSPTLSQFDDKSTYTRAVFDSLGLEFV